MRLFICLDCQTIEQLPDYEGPMIWDPEYKREVPVADDLLEYLIAPHKRGEHRGQLLHVQDKDWHSKTKREGILKEVQEGLSGHTGFDPETYAVRDTFQEDALKCFSAHNRPQDGCIDWHDRSKKLGNSLLTVEEKSDAKKFGLKRQNQRFLCDFCPVASQVQQKKNEKSGLYK